MSRMNELKFQVSTENNDISILVIRGLIKIIIFVVFVHLEKLFSVFTCLKVVVKPAFFLNVFFFFLMF